ncbi:MAG: NADH-quinone oxidoreductase subunit A [Pseudomonadota bacterium]
MGYLPLALYAAMAAALAALIVGLSRLVGQRGASTQLLMPYECGMDPTGDARICYGMHFYLVAVLFIVFDIEAVFLYPWALVLRWLGLFGLIEMAVFIGVLLLGLAYAWRRGALEWT